jgi:hypothetical protein
MSDSEDVLFGNEDDRYIVDIAARNPRIEVLRWVLPRGYRGSSEASQHAGLSNHLGHLKLLKEYDNLDTYQAMQGALHGDKIEVVHWLYSNGERGRGFGRQTGNASEKWLESRKHPGCEAADRVKKTVFKDLPLNDPG